MQRYLNSPSTGAARRGHRLWRFIQQHPITLLEHITLVMVVLLYLSKHKDAAHNAQKVRSSDLLCSDNQHTCCCPDNTPGPADAMTHKGVLEAPPPSLDVSALPQGKVVEHHDFRGDIFRFAMGGGVVPNLMRTVAGSMRSGDLHNCTQYDVILKGRARLRTQDLASGEEQAVEYGPNELIVIPPRVPHLFEFLEDNYMMEWWACEFRAWYYEPYRQRIAAQFKAQEGGGKGGKGADDKEGKAEESKEEDTQVREEGREAKGDQGEQDKGSGKSKSEGKDKGDGEAEP